MPTLPPRDVLRAEYDNVIREIDGSRSTPMLTNAFYRQISDSTFDACYRALADQCEAQSSPRTPPQLHVVSAPVGSGKTSFSFAFIVALVRLGENVPDAPIGCIFVADQITKADQVFRDLSALLPGKVAIWTTDHDSTARNESRREEARVKEPAATFAVDELMHYPVVIVTHAFYSGSRGYKAKHIRDRHGMLPSRALTIVDEKPNDVAVTPVLSSDVERVWEHVAQDAQASEEIKEYVGALAAYTRELAAGSRDLEAPTEAEAALTASRLRWFRTQAARDYARKHQRALPVIVAVFDYAESLSDTRAFVARSGGGKLTHFIGYRWKLTREHGMVLLDATADIDGVSQLCPWRKMQPVPKARYDNLTIVHVPSVTKARLSRFLTNTKNHAVYREHMERVIREQMEPGQRGLVVCKKVLLAYETVPSTTGGDYSWDIDGRRLATAHWGVGIGVNDWKDADVVFLFDEFYVPRRQQIATTQGLCEHKATEGSLAAMTTQNSKNRAVDTISEGSLLRWNKQMAIRGKGRRYDEHGICGKQKLVCTGDAERLLRNADRLFPGAKIMMQSGSASKQTDASRLYTLLSRPDLPPAITTNWIGQQLRKPWRDISKNLMRRETVKQAIVNLGWQYVPKAGRGGGSFTRVNQGVPMAA